MVNARKPVRSVVLFDSEDDFDSVRLALGFAVGVLVRAGGEDEELACDARLRLHNLAGKLRDGVAEPACVHPYVYHRDAQGCAMVFAQGTDEGERLAKSAWSWCSRCGAHWFKELGCWVYPSLARCET